MLTRSADVWRMPPIPVLLSVTTAALLGLAPTAAAAADRDSDSLPDRWERKHRVGDPGADPDRDRLTNLGEYLSRTDPRRRDSDRDRKPDAREDADRDGLTNREEMRFGWDPRKRDSDGDGIGDRRENSGVVTAVSGRRVTIRLAAGGQLTGRIDDPSALTCPGDDRLAGDDDEFWDPSWGEKPSDLDADEPDDAEEIRTPAARALTQVEPDDDDDAAIEALEAAGADEEDFEEAAPDPECETALRPGAVVHAATVSTSAGEISFTKLELLLGA